MASLQTNTILSSSAAANLATKANAPAQSNNADTTKFSDLLPQAQPKVAQAKNAQPNPIQSKMTARSGAKNRHDVSDKKSDAPHIKKASAKSDNKPSDKTDTANAANDKPAAKADTPPQVQTASTSDDDSAEENATANAQPGNNTPATDQDGKKAGDKDTASKNNTTSDANPIDATAAAAPQAPPPAAIAQAQQAMAAPAAAQTSATQATPANGAKVDGVASNAGTKSTRARAQTPRTPQPVNDNDGSADATGIKPETPISAAQASLKSSGHDNGKAASADAAKADAPQPQADAPPAPAAPPAQPNPNTAAANPNGIVPAQGPAAGGITAPAAANANVASNVHVGPQGATPNVTGLAVEIAAKSQSGSKEFQIRLDPPELGHVEVRLSIDATGKTEAHVMADQPQTLHLLQKDSSTLTNALRDAGLDVSQNGLNFSLKGQDRNSGDHGGGAQTRNHSMTLAATKTIDAAQSANAYLSSAGDARLDIHV